MASIAASVRSSSAALPATKPRSTTNLSPCPNASTAAAATTSATAANATWRRYGRRKRPTRASVRSAVSGGIFGAGSRRVSARAMRGQLGKNGGEAVRSNEPPCLATVQ